MLATRLLAALAPIPRTVLPAAQHRGGLMLRSAALHATRMVEADYGFDAGPRPPSEKQIRYAQTLAQQVALELPPRAATDSMECSAFIDMALAKVPPSPRQVEFAKSIAQQANIDLPEYALTSSKAISAYIEANQHLSAGMGGGMRATGAMASQKEPSEKQILFAVSLARRLGVGLSADVISNRQSMSTFIDESQRSLNNGMGGGMNGMANGVAAAGAFGGAMNGMSNGYGMGAAAVDAQDVMSAEETGTTGSEELAASIESIDSLFGDPAEGAANGEEPTYFKEGNIPF